jgi:protein arginine kinase activator
MRCEHCSQPATLKLTEIVAGEKRRVALCADCARSRGVLVNPAQTVEPDIPESPHHFAVTAKCPRCQTSLATIRRKGRVGCPQCYSSFRPQLRNLLRRVHGEAEHRGRRPDGVWPPLHQLRGELLEAIECEDFERAALLRDRLAGETGPNEGLVGGS